MTDTSLDLDGIKYACSPDSLDWFTPPSKVTNMATGHVIFNVEKLKTAHARWTLENINSPIPVHTLLIQPPLPRLSKRIVNYFNKTDPIRASLVSASTLLFILLLAIPCACKLFCPSFIPSCCPNISCHNKEQNEEKEHKRKCRQSAKQAEKANAILPPRQMEPTAPLLNKVNNAR